MLRYTQDALDDLAGQWHYIAKESQSEELADRFIDHIDDRALVYAQNPELGELRPDLETGVRCFPVGSYVVYYRACTNGIEVFQVLHGARNVKRHFRRP